MSAIQCPHCGKDVEVRVEVDDEGDATVEVVVRRKYAVEYRTGDDKEWRSWDYVFPDIDAARQGAWNLREIHKYQARVAEVEA